MSDFVVVDCCVIVLFVERVTQALSCVFVMLEIEHPFDELHVCMFWIWLLVPGPELPLLVYHDPNCLLGKCWVVREDRKTTKTPLQ